MSASTSFLEGTIPKKLKINGDSAMHDEIPSDVLYSEADSSSDHKASTIPSFADGPNPNILSPLGNGISNSEAVAHDGFTSVEDHKGDLEPSISSGSKAEPLQAMLDYVEPQYVDDKTRSQLESIENEIKEHVPLIARKELLEILAEEYDDDIYVQKIMDLQSKYRWLRRTRGDGNCFYRSLGFSIFENMMKCGDLEKANALKRFMVECKDGLVELSYPQLTMEDKYDPLADAQQWYVDPRQKQFCDSFNEQLSRVMSTPSEEEILDIFQNQGSSDFVVVWLRFLTVLQLQRDPDFYGNFIENHANVTDFCRNEVEPMFRESDHIHIIAVASLLNMKIRVEYMDRGGSPTVFSHDFPENEADPEIFMLYRPGHYDILYKF